MEAPTGVTCYIASFAGNLTWTVLASTLLPFFQNPSNYEGVDAVIALCRLALGLTWNWGATRNLRHFQEE